MKTAHERRHYRVTVTGEQADAATRALELWLERAEASPTKPYPEDVEHQEVVRGFMAALDNADPITTYRTEPDHAA